jgi:hypothetical protein
MKKVSLFSFLFFSSFFTFAQTLDEINSMMDKRQYKSAKEGIDKYMADAKNTSKADGWYYKGRIYNVYSYDSSLSKKDIFDLKLQSFDAFKKYQQLDDKDLRMKLEQYQSYLDLYFGLYDLGAQQFNAKDYASAYESFRKSMEVKDFILGKQYTYTQAKLYPLDTALVLNTAIAATQAKNINDALIYYNKLTDANVSGKGYEEVYEYLADYYSKQNDQAKMQAIVDKGKRFYPQNAYWTELELRQVSSKGDKAALFAKYEELLAKDPANFQLAYNYSIEMYNNMYGKDAAPVTDAARQKLTSTIKTAVASDKGIDATMLMSNHLFNVAADYSSQAAMIKSTKPDDVKKKSELKASSIRVMNETIPYAEAAVKFFESVGTLRPVQKANYKIVLGYLADIYNAKGDPKKAAEYDKKRVAADKM